MAKATALSADLMSGTQTKPAAAVGSREPVKVISPTSIKTEKQTPLQIRIPASEAKNIKREALEADQTISDFMLACFHAYMKTCKTI